ncbi:MAG TPA: DNA mismatch repair protein MutS [Vicinamibacterales bacterium]|jgi:DNA mismatch repair protein MutS|nr:DNA mismatch repair protein MutS [Vicinamibacterales bacterium]
MRQYLDAKQQYRDAILFFRMGDFYEMFYEDALVAARALDLALTSRSKDGQGTSIPMCGVPHHAVDSYLARLVKKGFRVAICDQVEDPKKAKGLVKREIVRVVSPGTLTDAQYLDAREPAFLLSIFESRIPGPESRQRNEPVWGVALLDLSTGEFSCAEYAGPAGMQALSDEISVLSPREVVAPVGLDVAAALNGVSGTLPVTRVEAWTFEYEAARRTLLEQLRAGGLEGFGLELHGPAVSAAGALLHYLRDTQKADLAHVRTVSLKTAADCLLIDAMTLRHLEVVESMEGGRDGTLLHEIDRTTTPMGGRLLRSWLLRPLVSLERIRDRLDAVEELAFRSTDRGKFRELLKAVHDLERLVARAALGTAGPRDLVALKLSIAAVPRIRLVLEACEAPLVRALAAALDDVADVRDAIDTHIVDEPAALARDGGYIRDSVDTELDELRRISRSGKQVIAELEERERARTGISSLKVRYNRVFGYYIEVSKSNLHAVPPDYHRKQTIAGGERFITPALKEYEEKVLGADERILEREIELFEQVRARVAAEAARIQESARALAALDTLAALAETATLSNYIKPHVHNGDDLAIADGRHPVVERRCNGAFVPNDVALDGGAGQLMILTGPNMGGKSTYLRQTALMCLMAQIGSFVPASRAKIPLLDRIYARVGASDNIMRGHSTFMVEMQETANILHGATSRSLVVLDEIGRGTATFDGLSIAWAVAEHLATNPRGRPKTLFATHYHELTDLADALPGVVNAHVAAREWQDEIVFLHKIVPGRSDRSYGIQVARLAGMPASVIERARAILEALEHDELTRGGRPSISGTPAEPQQQLGLFQALVAPAAPAAFDQKTDKVAQRLRDLDTDAITPLQALTILADLKKDAR